MPKFITLIFCGFIFCFSASAAEVTNEELLIIQQKVFEFEKERSEQEISTLQKAVEKENIQAMLDLAHIYRRGYIVASNGKYKDHYEPLKAIELYTKASQLGNIKAMLELGYMYYIGDRIARDWQKGIEWYTKAAELNNADAQCELGHFYSLGPNTDAETNKRIFNLEKSFNWYKKCAEQGNVRGQRNLGMMYEHGRYVSKDVEEAIKWYQLAIEQYDEVSSKQLGMIYYRGTLVPQNKMLAYQWLNLGLGGVYNDVDLKEAKKTLEETMTIAERSQALNQINTWRKQRGMAPIISD